MAEETIKSGPTKTLFIDIITRDIDVKDCILELIDNCVDSYKRHNITDRRKIEITFNSEKFEIFDTCGGIEQDILENKAFIFGVDELKREKGTLGLYGIGMKRALFKIGKNISVETDNGEKNNTLNIDVNEWKKLQEWDFKGDFVDAKSKEEGGYTKICITDLNEICKDKFSNQVFINSISEIVSKMYTFFIQKNIDFSLNGSIINPFNIDINFEDQLQPNRFQEVYKGIGIDIICHIVPKKETRGEGRIGWNIFVNKRLILSDDTTKFTGWDGNQKGLLPSYHSLYNPFRGLVFLSADDPALLPLNTSKNGLNIDDKNYYYILSKMVEVARPLINYLTKISGEEKIEFEEPEKEVEVIEEKEETKTNKVSIDDVPIQMNFSPPVVPATNKTVYVTISYRKPKSLAQKVKDHIRGTSFSNTGEKLFDYYVNFEEIK